MYKKGIALVVTIMVLLVLSILATGMMYTVKSETAISIYQAKNVQTVQVAEAALDEVKYRLRLDPSDSSFIGDTASTLNTDWETIIVFGNPPSDTGNTHYRKSLQTEIDDFDPDNPELDYTTKDVSDISLRVHHKLSSDSSQIYFFDSSTQRQFLGPPSLVTEYPPVEVVEITARAGNATKKIMAEISKQEVVLKTISALSSSAITWRMTGNTDIYVCGHNHKMSTPYDVAPFDPTASPPRKPGSSGNAISCWKDTVIGGDTIPLYHVQTRYDSTEHPLYNHYYYNPYTHTEEINRIEYDPFCSEVGCVAGIATTAIGVGNYGATKSHMFGNPDIIVKQEIVIPEIWEVLGFESEAEMNDAITWETTIRSATSDDDIGFFKLPGGTQIPFNSTIKSRGVIWVDGDLFKRSGSRSFFHKGLLYVSGDFKESSAGGTYDLWILGTMMVNGNIDSLHTSGNSRIFFMYSKDALTSTVESSLSYYKLLGWKEVE